MSLHPSPFTAARGLVYASTESEALGSLLFLHLDVPRGRKDRATDRRPAQEAGPNLYVVQLADRALFMTPQAALRPTPD